MQQSEVAKHSKEKHRHRVQVILKMIYGGGYGV